MAISVPAAILAGLVALGSCGGGERHPTDASGPAVRLTLIVYGTTGNPFWAKVITGAQEAARHLNTQVDVQFADNDPVQQNNFIETAIASGTRGIGVVIDQADAYVQNIERAQKRDIPVIAFNINALRDKSLQKSVAFVGQNFDAAGYLIGQRMVRSAGIHEGQTAVCPVEHPEAAYASQRHAGVERALRQVGATCELINTGGIGVEDTLTKLAQYLIGHPQTVAVIGLGTLPTEAAPQAIREAHLTISNGGFDITPTILRDILDGDTVATVDQQPFYQGYLTITQLYFAATYGLTPVDIDTGAALVDKTNAAAALKYADRVR